MEGEGEGERTHRMDGEAAKWRKKVFNTRISRLSPKAAGSRVSGLGNYDCNLGLLADFSGV